MAAKNINEALAKADIKLVLLEVTTLKTTPLCKLEEKIDAGEEVIKQNLRNQLKDLLSHRFQIFGFKYGCDSAMREFFKELFGEENE